MNIEQYRFMCLNDKIKNLKIPFNITMGIVPQIRNDAMMIKII